MSDPTTPKEKEQEPMTAREELRQSVRFMYDLQQARIQSGNRGGSKTAALSKSHQERMIVQSWLLKTLESNGLSNVNDLLKNFPIWIDPKSKKDGWLKRQKGCGPTMAGVLISEIDITRAETPSALWSYCGLSVKTCSACNGTGKAKDKNGVSKPCEMCCATGTHGARRVKGEKARYNPWLKAKVVKVLAECLIKANSPWREYYDNYKRRKENTMTEQCMGCLGTGKVIIDKKKVTCPNCEGTGGPAPWGKRKAHRDAAAKRYMAKMFLLELWKEWRLLEGLPIVDPYSEAYLGRKHGDHKGTVSRDDDPPEARV
jgi:hypothetical protein